MENKVILVKSNRLGEGAEELGEVLMETYFTLLKQRENLPHAIFFLNSGVLTLTEDSLVSVHLQELEEKGVELLVCKTCIDYYGIEEKLSVGKISGMAAFMDLAAKHEVITL